MVVSIEHHDDIAVVVITNPPVNALGAAARDQLFKAVDTVEADDTIRSVVLMCAGRTFAAGADVAEFGKVRKPPTLPDVINKIEASTKTWTAAIHGYALGGGFELALGCHHRVATPTAEFGLPEVTLGLMPGAGGIVRLPRLIPMDVAFEFITTGQRFGARRALELGCIDEIVDGDLLTAAIAVARKNAEGTSPGRLSEKPVISPKTPFDWEQAISDVKRRAAGQESPVVAAQTLQAVTGLPADEAMAIERARFQELTHSAQSAALRHIFFAEKAVAKPAMVADVRPSSVASVGVLGGGLMGSGIAMTLIMAGLPTVLVEREQDRLTDGLARVESYLKDAQSRGLLEPEDAKAKRALLTGALDYGAFADCDLIIEAVFEDMAVKTEVFAQLSEVTRPDTILASNTSYLDINEIAMASSHPERVIGIHFFAPAHAMKLVEIIYGQQSSQKVLSTAFDLVRKLGKKPVLAGVCDGFIGNRILAAYRAECERMLEEGSMPWDVDRAMRAFGFRMGPFQVQDLSGHGIALARRKRLSAAGTLPTDQSGLPDQLCAAGRMGRGVGKGWYDYNGDGEVPSGDVEDIIIAESKRKGISRRELPSEEIVGRALATISKEADLLLTESVIEAPEAVDVVLVNGYGFPRWRGGPMFMRRCEE
ncbi:MAG: 3-hydroxyacyl-CoA dehydrogenase NAD-binding domain-containing protein [Pseudomonadota bacterium]